MKFTIKICWTAAAWHQAGIDADKFLLIEHVEMPHINPAGRYIQVFFTREGLRQSMSYHTDNVAAVFTQQEPEPKAS